jgi:gas vesicle protein
MLRDIQTIGAFVPPTTAVLYSPHMAEKTRTKKRKATLDSVLSTVERGFADLEGKMDRGFAAVAEDITDIKSKMATKDDIADVKSTLADHTKILNDHTRDLAIIKKDLTTNLDKRLQLEVRVSAVEKHLGLNKKIAA